jgi:hypothetical protein
MLKFLKKLLDTPDKKALRDLRNAERDIAKAGGYLKYIEGFVKAYIRDDSSYVFLFGGITLDGTADFNSAALRLACLKHLHRLRVEKLAEEYEAGLNQLELLKNLHELRIEKNTADPDAVPKASESADELSLEITKALNSTGKIEKDNKELLLTRLSYQAAGFFVQPIDIENYESSSEFKSIHSGTFNDVREYALGVLAKKMLQNHIEGIREEPFDVIASAVSEDPVVRFFQTKALDRAQHSVAEFDEWAGADLRTLGELVRGQ